MIQLEVFIEKIKDRGEDSEPILKTDGNSVLVGVFDGLGGAGSKEYSVMGVKRTGAYLSSRIVRNVVESYFQDAEQMFKCLNLNDGQDYKYLEHFMEGLKNKIKEELAKQIELLDDKPSMIKSNLIKRFPTTMTLAYFWESPHLSNKYNGLVMWAGDSRCYTLDNKGLSQLTKDDLRDDFDAFQNLQNDSPLSNYINADVDFKINISCFTIDSPFVLIAATDGSFGYLHTPMHFEYKLLDTILGCKKVEYWKKQLENHLSEIAADDVSMAVVAVGWDNLTSLSEYFKNRRKYLYEHFIKEIDGIVETIRIKSSDLQELQSKKELLLRDRWQDYKCEYERRLNLMNSRGCPHRTAEGNTSNEISSDFKGG